MYKTLKQVVGWTVHNGQWLFVGKDLLACLFSFLLQLWCCAAWCYGKEWKRDTGVDLIKGCCAMLMFVLTEMWPLHSCPTWSGHSQADLSFWEDGSFAMIENRALHAPQQNPLLVSPGVDGRTLQSVVLHAMEALAKFLLQISSWTALEGFILGLPLYFYYWKLL